MRSLLQRRSNTMRRPRQQLDDCRLTRLLKPPQQVSHKMRKLINVWMKIPLPKNITEKLSPGSGRFESGRRFLDVVIQLLALILVVMVPLWQLYA